MLRHSKVTEAIRKEASIIVHDELKDPRLGFVTITRVEMTPDLRSAKIFFSVLGTQDDYKKTKEALDSASGFIRRLIAQRINLRFAPEILFREDRSAEYSVRIEELLNQIKESSQPHYPSHKQKGRVKPKKKGHDEPRKSRRVRKKT